MALLTVDNGIELVCKPPLLVWQDPSSAANR